MKEVMEKLRAEKLYTKLSINKFIKDLVKFYRYIVRYGEI